MDRRTFLGGAGILGLLGTAGCLCGYTATAAEETTTGTSTTPGPPAGTTQDGTTPPTPTTTPGDGTPTPSDGTPTDGTPTDGTPTPTPTTTTPTPTPTPAPSSVTVEVGKDGTFYEPQRFEVARGGTVEWVWVGNNHNIIVDSQPSGANWSGTPGSDSRTYNEGYTYSHTFDVAGEYEYHCYMHGEYGMVGSFRVV